MENVPSWRLERAHGEREPSERCINRQVTRWVTRHAGSALCGAWPAAFDRIVGHRLLVLCKTCNARPNSDVRLREIVSQGWRREHTIEPNVRSN
jgi:hypothetical protein